jgi:hypothetical protein
MTTAEDVTQRHAQAINNRDLASYLETMNFPFTYHNYNGVALTVEKASDCGVDAPLPWDITLKGCIGKKGAPYAASFRGVTNV